MSDLTSPRPAFGTIRRGIRAIDVEQAAEALLRQGERPTIEKIRARLGTGSPNTINPLLDAWWKKIGGRLQTIGPAALERVPEVVAHVAEALWLQALDESRRRVATEASLQGHKIHDREQALEIKSHVLTLREGEMVSRLQERDKRIADLELNLRETVMKLKRQEQSNASLERKLVALSQDLAAVTTRQQDILMRRPKPRSKRAVTTKRRLVTRMRPAKSKKRGRG
jgi:hypothetical protein